MQVFICVYYSTKLLPLTTLFICHDLKLYKKRERKPKYLQNLFVQTYFCLFYIILLKYFEGMHTNKLWYVKKKNYLFS